MNNRKEDKEYPTPLTDTERFDEIIPDLEDDDMGYEDDEQEHDDDMAADNDTDGDDEGRNITSRQKLKEAIERQAREEEQPQSSNFSIWRMINANLLASPIVRRQVWLLLLIMLILVLYTSNRFSVQNQLVEIAQLEAKLKDIKYHSLSSSSILTEKSRESQILKLLRENNDTLLNLPDQPAFIITIPKKK